MSWKHFRMLAEALKLERPTENWSPNKEVQWELDVKAVARACKSMNPGFKPERFYDACGGLFEEVEASAAPRVLRAAA
jgi:hypothetical protein